jgi:Holliday junction resolvasome RuvABC endonuclease subunit
MCWAWIWGTTLGVSRIYVDGEIDAQALRFKGNIGSRTVGVSNVIKRHVGPDCIGVCIEEPFSGQFSSVKALFPMLGAAVLACELAGLPWSTIHLARLKIAATGKGNAKKPQMQAAAKARWGKDLGEDEADAAWAGAYALDNSLFQVSEEVSVQVSLDRQVFLRFARPFVVNVPSDLNRTP